MSRTQALRALTDAGLLALNEQMVRHVEVVPAGDDGQLHSRYCNLLPPPPRPQTQSVPVAHILTDAPLCPECAEYTIRAAIHKEMWLVLDMHALIRTADRARAKSPMPKSVPATLRDLRDNAYDLQHRPKTAALNGAYSNALTQGVRAAELLEEAHRCSGTTRTDVLARIRKEFLDGKEHLGPALDVSEHLIGIHPPMDGSGLAEEALSALKVQHTGAGQVLRAPRYVADYLLANMYRTHPGTGHPIVVSAPVGTSNDVVVEVAAGLWSPQHEGPLVAMGVALQTAHTVTEP